MNYELSPEEIDFALALIYYFGAGSEDLHGVYEKPAHDLAAYQIEGRTKNLRAKAMAEKFFIDHPKLKIKASQIEELFMYDPCPCCH